MKEYVRLAHKVEVFIPSQDKHGNRIPASRIKEIRDSTAEALSGMFGGCTGSKAVGFYKSETLGHVQTEDIDLLFAYAEIIDADRVEEIATLAGGIKEALEQESVMVTIDGTALVM
jgi:hypothetical protein